MQHLSFASVLLLVAAIVVTSCDDPPSSSSIARSSTSPTAGSSLTGAWAGTATDSTGQVQMLWQLTQSAANVTGTVRATTNVGLPLYTGTMTGALAAGTLTFTMTVPAGSIVELPECSLTLNGSATDLQAGSIAGTYTGTHSCLGAVAGGRFLFIKG